MIRLFHPVIQLLQRAIGATAVAAVLLSTAVSSAAAQGESAKRVDDVIRQIVVASHGPNAVDFALRELGFPPEHLRGPFFRPPGYKQLPDARKLAAAYHAANAAVPGSGETLLRQVLVLTAQKNIALTADPAFRAFVVDDSRFAAIHGSGAEIRAQVLEFRPTRFEFTQPATERLNSKLPERARQIIDTVVRHAPRTPGGLAAMVRACCGIVQEAAFDRMHRARSVEDIVRWAIREGRLPPELESRLTELIRHVERANIALSADAIVAELAAASQRYAAEGDPFAEAVRRYVAEPSAVHGTAVRQSLDGAAEAAADLGRPLPAVVEALTEGALGLRTGADTAARSRLAAASDFTSFQAQQYGVLPSRGDGGRSLASTGTRSGASGNASRSAASHIGNGSSSSGIARSVGPRTSAMRFSEIRLRAGGFGGVILGNEVGATGIGSSPMWFDWIESPEPTASSDAVGLFRIFFADGTVAMTEATSSAAARAALAMVYTGFPGLVAPLDVMSGDAVGLAGFTGQHDYQYFANGRVMTAKGAARTFVVHPAIAGTTLGEDAVLVDAVPFNIPDTLAALFDKKFLDRKGAEAEQLRRSFRAWLYDEARSTYKFHDAALKITPDHTGVLRVFRQTRPGDSPSWSDALRGSSLITFQKFDLNGEPAAEERPPFYHLTPAISEVWPSFRRLNAFAGTVGVIRWLRSMDAVFVGELPASSSGLVRNTLVVMPNGETRLEPPLYEVTLSLAERVREAATPFMAGLSSDARALADEIHNSRLQRIHVREALRRYGLPVLLRELEFAEDLLAARQKSAALSQLEALSRDTMSAEFRGVYGRLSGVDVASLTASDRLMIQRQIADTSRTARMNWLRMRARFLETTQGRFLRRLEQAEADAARASPLAQGRLAVKLRLLGGLPAASGERHRALALDVERLEVELDTINETLAFIEIGASDPQSFVDRLGAAAERAAITPLINEVARISAEIADPDRGFISRWWKSWSLSAAEERLSSAIAALSEAAAARLNAARDRVQHQLDQRRTTTEEFYQQAIEEAPLPGFDEWWTLQSSFRQRVFTPIDTDIPD